MTHGNHYIQSEENLSHFSCTFCRQWWSIGDAPPDRGIWHCPWCGKLLTAEGVFVSQGFSEFPHLIDADDRMKEAFIKSFGRIQDFEGHEDKWLAWLGIWACAWKEALKQEEGL